MLHAHILYACPALPIGEVYSPNVIRVPHNMYMYIHKHARTYVKCDCMRCDACDRRERRRRAHGGDKHIHTNTSERHAVAHQLKCLTCARSRRERHTAARARAPVRVPPHNHDGLNERAWRRRLAGRLLFDLAFGPFLFRQYCEAV